MLRDSRGILCEFYGDDSTWLQKNLEFVRDATAINEESSTRSVTLCRKIIPPTGASLLLCAL